MCVTPARSKWYIVINIHINIYIYMVRYINELMCTRIHININMVRYINELLCTCIHINIYMVRYINKLLCIWTDSVLYRSCFQIILKFWRKRKDVFYNDRENGTKFRKFQGLKLDCLNFIIPPPSPQKTRECAMAPSSNSMWQNRKQRSNRYTNNGNIVERAKRPVSE